MTANGYVPRSALTEAEKGILLDKRVARAYRRVKAMFYDLGDNLRLIDGSSGYRSYAVQKAMYEASVGHDAAAKRKWNLDPNSTVPLAHPGGSSHGFGTRLDLLVNGHTPNASQRALLAMAGFTREFGGRDPNHFEHDLKTSVTPVDRQFCLNHKLFVQPE